LEAKDLRVGDYLTECRLPEPDKVKRPAHITLDAAWLAGLYIAEGSSLHKEGENKFVLAGHTKEVARWHRVRQIAEAYGGSAKLYEDGNCQTIQVHGKLVCAVLKELTAGHDAADKAFGPTFWRYGNDFLEAALDGYLSGDGSHNVANRRWRIGFVRNSYLERDLRALCARLGFCLTLNQITKEYNGATWHGFRGEIRKTRSGHLNEKDRMEVVAIRKARSRVVYEVGVEDEPHLFALASGVLTHNSKPDPMPESVTNRSTKAHEYVFHFAKGPRYFYDAEAIKERMVRGVQPTYQRPRKDKQGIGPMRRGSNNEHHQFADPERLWGNPTGRNKRSVWTISHGGGYKGGHFACFPKALVEVCVKAGTSEKGCCPKCGAPWARVLGQTRTATRPGHATKTHGGGAVEGERAAPRLAGDVTGNRDPARHVTETRTLGWRPGCACYGLPLIGNQPREPKRSPKERENAWTARYGKYQAALASWEKTWDEVRDEYEALLDDVDGTDGGSLVPCVVLDPFVGSGTAALVALALGRHTVGVDVSEVYLRDHAAARVRWFLLSRPAYRGLVPME
jgi:hypothetical protein